MNAKSEVNGDLDADFERYAYALALFVFGVALLGHGMAATVFVDGVTATTVALPLVGSVLAYRSFAGALPSDSSLSADGFLVLLSVLTAGFVNLVVPPVYASANVLPSAATPPTYWGALVVGVAGFAAFGVYELLADRVSGGHALAKLFGAALVATGVGILMLAPPAQSFAFSAQAQPGALARVGGSADAFLAPDSSDALPAVVGAVLAAAPFDYTAVHETGNESPTETGSGSPTETGSKSSAQ